MPKQPTVPTLTREQERQRRDRVIEVLAAAFAHLRREGIPGDFAASIAVASSLAYLRDAYGLPTTEAFLRELAKALPRGPLPERA